ncbi:hypothetical protein J6590_079259 [Homalodisca vitripennis]|nr:hypothetical protein J6590_079259 [Homalodisca vitripennis]
MKNRKKEKGSNIPKSCLNSSPGRCHCRECKSRLQVMSTRNTITHHTDTNESGMIYRWEMSEILLSCQTFPSSHEYHRFLFPTVPTITQPAGPYPLQTEYSEIVICVPPACISLSLSLHES